MRTRLIAATTAALAIGLIAAVPASAGTATRLTRDKPAWYTPQLHAKVLAAGARGVRVAEEQLNLECPGVAQRGVSAGGCIVAPFGCTANFIFSDGRSRYIGTARHCIKDIGSKLVMQVDTATLAAVGTVVKKTAGACPEDDAQKSPGCEPGNDFALIRLDRDVVRRYGVNPAIPIIGGPSGVYSGCAPQPVLNYGHGYFAAVAQGKPQGGLATNWLRSGYGWTGAGINGDSGSPVVLADRRAAGNFTHIVVDIGDYPASNLAGMRMTAILQFLGGGIRLVQANGSTTGSGGASCTSAGSREGRSQTIGADVGVAVPDVPQVDVADVPVDLPVVDGDDEDDEDDDDKDDDGLLGKLGL